MGFLTSFLKDLLGLKEKYGEKCTTLKGEKVKSRGEKKIADYFYQNKIKYEYEKAAKTRGLIFHEKISSPDFYLPDYNTYVEYWGLVDCRNECDRIKYVKAMRWKMAQYKKNKIKFVSIYPKNLRNFDWIFRKKFENETGVTIDNQVTKRYCNNCGTIFTPNSQFCLKCEKKEVVESSQTESLKRDVNYDEGTKSMQANDRCEILRKYGSDVAEPHKKADLSFGYLAIIILNCQLRPVLSKWHPLLMDYEDQRKNGISIKNHEDRWEHNKELRNTLNETRKVMMQYSDYLAKVANTKSLYPDEKLRSNRK